VKPARAALTATVAVVGVLLAVVLISWTATIGPSGVLTGDGPEQHLGVTPTVSEPSSFDTRGMTSEEDLVRQAPEGNPVVSVIVLLLVLGLAVVLLFLGNAAYRAWREDREARRRARIEELEVEFDVLDAPADVVQALARDVQDDAAAQERLLTEGTPRNAVVACWHRFEQLAGARGLRRRSWETSSEFTIRVLDLVGVDSHAVTGFAELYREARFSEHEVGEGHRARALEVLRRIHADLGAGRPT
jgi:ABC-type multidrug transport system fused ATPase/permease subunit